MSYLADVFAGGRGNLGFNRGDLKKDLLPSGLIIAVSLALFIAASGSYGLQEPDEAFLPQVAREMAESGKIFSPTYLDESSPESGLPAVWCMVVTASVTGWSEWGVRLAGALACVLGLLFLYWSVSRLSDRLVGLAAALILATSPQYYGLAQSATPHPFIAMAVTGAMGAVLLGLDHIVKWKVAASLAALFSTLAFALSGPQAVLIMAMSLLLLAIGLFFDSSRYRLDMLKSIGKSAGLGAAIFIPLCALVILVLWQANDSTFIREFTGSAWFDQMFGNPTKMTKRVEYYVRGAAYAGFPWSSLLPLALFALAGKGIAGKETERSRHGLFLVLFFAAGIILLTAESARHYPYLLLVLPACAASIALGLRTIQQTWDSRSIRVGVFLSFLLFLVCRKDFSKYGLEYLFETFGQTLEFPDDFTWSGKYLHLSLVFWLVALALLFIMPRHRWIFLAPLMCGLVIAACGSWFVIPGAGNLNSPKAAVEKYREETSGEPLYAYRKITPGLMFYGRQDVISIRTKLTPVLKDAREDKRFFVIVAQRDYRSFNLRIRHITRRKPLRVLCEGKGGYWLVSNQ
ncbi:ArnT family glycosyltransferase [Acidobacteriota bacterium]